MVFARQEGKEVDLLGTQTRSVLKRKAVRQFIKENGKYITQVESAFYTLLDQRTKSMILKAIRNNASRKRLTQYELLGSGDIGK